MARRQDLSLPKQARLSSDGDVGIQTAVVSRTPWADTTRHGPVTVGLGD